VTRFLRQVAAYLPLIDPAELDVVDLVTLIHLRSFAPATYRLLAQSKRMLTGSELLPEEAPFRNILQGRVMRECGDVCDEVQDGIIELFPALHDNSSDVPGSVRAKLDVVSRAVAKRVSAAEYFDRYFLLGLPITDVSDVTAQDGLRAIARGEPSEARMAVEERIHAEDPAAVGAALRKLARFTETDNFLVLQQ
jgi:hypothetical protein